MLRVPQTPGLRWLLVMETFSGLSRGAFLVAIGWTTLVVTDDVGRVGQVFVIAMLTSLVGGPLVGTVVDRHDRKRLVIVAHAGIALALVALAALWLPGAEPHVAWLFAAVAVASALRQMHNAAHDGILQALSQKADLIHVVARFRGVHLIATVVGTVGAGWIMDRISPAAGFYLSAIFSLLLILPMIPLRVPRIAQGARGVGAFVADLRGGVAIFADNRAVRLLAILAGVSLPVGQLSNAVLSSLVRDDLGLGSDVFGVVDAAWPLGGMLAAGLLSLGNRRLAAQHMEYVFALLAGAATVALALVTAIPLLVGLHGLMGLSVWLCRIVIDGRILEICAPETVGRTKVGVEMMFSLSALIMCLSPTLVQLERTGGYFLFWGSLMMGVSVAVLALSRRVRP